jgi:hypothetical protein
VADASRRRGLDTGGDQAPMAPAQLAVLIRHRPRHHLGLRDSTGLSKKLPSRFPIRRASQSGRRSPLTEAFETASSRTLVRAGRIELRSFPRYRAVSRRYRIRRVHSPVELFSAVEVTLRTSGEFTSPQLKPLSSWRSSRHSNIGR